MLSTILLYLFISIIFICYPLIINGKDRDVRRNHSSIRNNIFRFLIAWILILIATFRNVSELKCVGTDTYVYVKFFNSISHNEVERIFSIHSINDLLNNREPLYVLFTYLIRLATNDYHIYYVIIYGFVVCTILHFISKFYAPRKPDLSLVLAACFYLYSFNVMRGCISVCFCVLAFCDIVDEKWTRALLLIFIGAMFHYMGFCFVAVWLVCKINSKHSFLLNKTVIIVAICINLFFAIFAPILLQYATKTRYVSYVNLKSSILGHIPSIAIDLFATWLFQRKYCENKMERSICLALFVQLCFQYVISGLSVWRISDFFTLIEMFFISSCINKWFARKDVLMKILMSIFLIMRIYMYITSLYESSDLFPYF